MNRSFGFKVKGVATNVPEGNMDSWRQQQIAACLLQIWNNIKAYVRKLMFVFRVIQAKVRHGIIQCYSSMLSFDSVIALF